MGRENAATCACSTRRLCRWQYRHAGTTRYGLRRKEQWSKGLRFRDSRSMETKFGFERMIGIKVYPYICVSPLLQKPARSKGIFHRKTPLLRAGFCISMQPTLSAKLQRSSTHPFPTEQGVEDMRRSAASHRRETLYLTCRFAMCHRSTARSLKEPGCQKTQSALRRRRSTNECGQARAAGN